jgi:glycosyltransferase involved in cell wall biosynthesis
MNHRTIEPTAGSQSSSPVADVEWPKITVVTAVRNGARYIDATMRSVVLQAYPNLEYIVVDGDSTDGTQDIIEKYQEHIAWWISEPDKGLYDALNKGFERSTGTIMGWLNASDMLHTGGLAVVGSVFLAFPSVQWITGRPTAFAEDGTTTGVGPVARWSRRRYLAGANRYIQQESTYWRRDLWQKSGGHVDATRRDASDCELWLRFFRHARLYSVDSLIAGFRMHADSIFAADRDGYHRSMEEILWREINLEANDHWVRNFRHLNDRMSKVPKVRGLWKRMVESLLYQKYGTDWPPVIRNRDGIWHLV